MDKNKNENNNLIDVNYNTSRGRSDSGGSNNSSSSDIPPPPPTTFITEEQQKKLEEHLTPPNLPMMPNIDLNKNNNKFDLNNNNDNSDKGGITSNDEEEDNDGHNGDNDGDNKEKKKKKKKKDKKKDKKKNKHSSSSDDDDRNDVNKNLEDQDVERVIIKSPILLKSKKNKENLHHDPYSTEMSPIESNIHHQSSTPQIQVDPEMYFDGGFKKEKKKKKKKNKDKDGDRFLTPEERRIKENSKDAKSFFSNERTFLSWIGLTFSLGAIGTAILTWFGSEGVSLATGVFLWAIAMVFMAYSTLQFRRRGHAIRTKTQGPFDDQKGPLSLVAMVVIGVSIYLIFFVVIRPSVNIGGGGGNDNSAGSTK